MEYESDELIINGVHYYFRAYVTMGWYDAPTRGEDSELEVTADRIDVIEIEEQRTEQLYCPLCSKKKLKA